MAEASNIGANFSTYTGDPNLGGGTLGAFKLDTGPLQDFARYTMLFNREEQEQKEKAAQKAAAEIAKLTGLDISTSIPKDAKVLREDYDALHQYLRENPEALKYSTNPAQREKWFAYNKMKADLENKIKFATIRDVINKKRQEDIAKETNEGVRNVLKEKLQKNIDATDIFTPIEVFEKNDLTVPEAGKNVGQSIEVLQTLPNEILQTKTKIFDAAEADRQGSARALGINFDKNTETGQQKDIVLKDNIYVKGSELLTKLIGEASAGIDPKLDDVAKKEAIRQKISGVGLARNMVDALDKYNAYVTDIQKRFKAGELSGNGINPDAYTPINWLDGVDPVEYTKLEQFLNWAGDEKDTKVITTNDAIERARIGLGYANLDFDKQKDLSSKTEDWISADAVVRKVQDAIKNATPLDIRVDGKVQRQVRQIADPSLLKEFGNIDKDGNVTNVPSMVIYDPKDNQLSLIYHQEDDPDTDKDESKGQTGGARIRREEKLDANDWIGNITRRYNPNKDIGGINAIVQQIYTNNGRNLVELAKNYGGQGATATQKVTTKDQSFYSDKKNVKSQNGNRITYSDGSIWEIQGDKFVRIN